MEQVLFGGYYDNLSPILTKYNGVADGDTWTLPEFQRATLVSTPGKIKNLRVKLDGAPGAGKSYVFTLRVSGADSTLTCTISDAATSAEDLVNEVDVVAGDYISLSCTPSGSPTGRATLWTTMFEGSNANESLLLSVGYTLNTVTKYAPVSSSYPFGTTVENDVRQVCPTSGKIKNFYVRLATSPGTAPDAYTFTLRVNGVPSALTVTITAPNTTGNDTTHEVTVSAGDVLTFEMAPIETPSASPEVNFGMTFVADVDGESLILGGTWNDLPAAATEYNSVLSGSASVSWQPIESERYELGQACTLKKLYMLLSGAPGDGKSYTFTVREGGDTAITVTISGAATTGNDTAHKHSVADGDEVALKCTPAGTPDVRDAYWGLAQSQYIPPAAVGGSGLAQAAKLLLT